MEIEQHYVSGGGFRGGFRGGFEGMRAAHFRPHRYGICGVEVSWELIVCEESR